MDAQYEWSKWWQLGCPARAVRGRGDYPGCDLRRGHNGPHVAERGMFNEVWSEQWQ